MKVDYHKGFLKSYKSRIANNTKLVAQTKERITLFLKDSRNPILRDHLLRGGKRERRAFSITGDIRIVYRKTQDKILFYDIGTHNQVY